METKVYHTIDKSSWGDGPWLQEPDKMQWRDQETGLPCLIVRSHGITGSLCGYVGVFKNHPYYGRGYDDFYEDGLDIDVHGGLTFAGMCAHSEDESDGICHVPGPGEPDDVFWFGFDCSHAFDYNPKMKAWEGTIPAFRELNERYKEVEEVYRNWSYVTEQVTNLASQLHAIKPDDRP